MLRLILLLCLISPSAFAADDLASTVKSVIEQAQKDGATMTLPVNNHQEEGVKKAQETAKQFYSPEFQEKLQCEQQRLKKEVFVDYIDEPTKEKPLPQKLADNERVYFFFSSSMPDATVQAYLGVVAQIDEPNLVMLMRGFVPGERGNYLIRVVKKDLNCKDQMNPKKICDRYEIPIKIKPSLFDKFKVTQVPALVYEKGESAWKITGDAALDYLLERTNQEVQSPGLDGLINTLRGS